VADLETMPNEKPGVPLWVENRVSLPRCCPVSGNPQPGSSLTLRYRARDRVLEVYSLQAHIRAYVGGHADGTRNMEAMVQQIAQVAADVLGVAVRAVADLNLQAGQKMRLVVRARP
jgi:hypothetical protein